MKGTAISQHQPANHVNTTNSPAANQPITSDDNLPVPRSSSFGSNFGPPPVSPRTKPRTVQKFLFNHA